MLVLRFNLQTSNHPAEPSLFVAAVSLCYCLSDPAETIIGADYQCFFFSPPLSNLKIETTFFP